MRHERLIRLTVLVLSLAGCASGIAQRVMDPLLPRLGEEFSQPLSSVSWVVTSFSLGYALSQLLFGPLGDRYGKLRVISWGCAGCFAAALACALAPTLPWLIAARAVSGMMSAALIPLAMAWIGDVVPYEKRQPVLATYSIGQVLGVSFGQLLGGLSADYLGRSLPFLLLCVMFAASAVLLVRVRRELESATPPAPARGVFSFGQLAHSFAQVLRERWARTVVLTVFLEGALVLGTFAFLATHLHTTLGIAMSAAGSIAMLFGLGGLVYALTARQLLGRFGELGLIRTGGLLLLVMMGVVAFAPTLLLVVPACLAMGLGFYMLHSTLQTNATQMAPERRGAAVAAFALSYFMGQALGVAVAGWLVSRAGTPGVIFGAGMLVVLVTLNFARAKQRRLAA